MPLIVPKEPTSDLKNSYFLPSLLAARAYKIDTPDIKIKLDQNETPTDWPEEIKQSVLKRLETISWNRYPSAFSPEINQLIADYAGVPLENVITGPGTNYLISMMISCLTKKITGNVIIAQPSFPLYEGHCQYDGIPYQIWPLNDDLEYDLSKLPEVTKNSLVIFASPNNPVGNIFPKKDLASLLSKYPDSIFMADEAYFRVL